MIPEKIGRYEIKSELGRGGMATVFHAYDPSFERNVAVKILPQALLHDPQFRTRFEREAKTIAALEHGAIVPVYDFGEDEGQPYIVMRLMTGGSLADKLGNSSLTLKEATRIIIRLAPALDAAHNNGIVHRDLKPGNILFDQYGNAFLSDFGIARLTESGATLTGGNILGTPAYMSPEQVQGDKDLDGRSDIYSMGIIFYQMLIGNTPFQSSTPAKVMMMHILEPVPHLLEVKPDLPVIYETVLEKTLAKDPEDRYSTTVEMAEALQSAERDQTLFAPRTLDQTRVASGVTQVPSQRTIVSDSKIPTPTSLSQPSSVSSRVPPARKPVRWLPFAIGGGIIFVLGAVIILGGIFFGSQGSGPLSALFGGPKATQTASPPTITISPDTDIPVPAQTETGTATPVIPTEQILSLTPTLTLVPPTETKVPTNTFTPSPTTPSVPIIGGSDKVAFLNANNVWMMNLDGSDLVQMTTDGAVKTNLNWSPDGELIVYISGKCIWSIEYDTMRQDHIACFETANLLEAFEISRDGAQVAISLNRELYIIPFEREQLAAARFHTHLREMNVCPALSPLKTSLDTTVPVKFVRWSEDNQRLAILILANEDGKQVDLIRYIDISNCDILPPRIDEFPATRFDMAGYDNTPYIQTIGFDGGFLFALNSYTRNDGFGELYVYNTDLHRADLKINPIAGDCCYRDARFSPDGRYLIFAFQPYEAMAKASIYYISYGSIGTGAVYQPLVVPNDFFSNQRGKPQPALRPIQNE